jgi:hypothetical protein
VQEMHAVALEPEEYLPAAQTAQAEAFEAGEIVPAAQVSHTVAPLEEE